jgi:hypothetical protein
MNMNRRIFPSISARNLEGLDVVLPKAFAGERNVVMVAFQRQHQELVDSWVPWLEQQAAFDTGLRFYEIPTIGRLWAPARRFIDGGMAAAIRVPAILQRTFTVYGDVSRLTTPLGITDMSTIAVVFVDSGGDVLCQDSGGFTAEKAEELGIALTAHRNQQ